MTFKTWRKMNIFSNVDTFFCQQRIQCEQDASRSRKQAHYIGGVHPPEGSEDVVMQLEFQAKAHQAGRTAAPTGTL